MDNVTIKLQEFLDGSLPPEEEAELLHRLSVSPERRELLRSYMKQQAVLNADRASIAVPYEAEQKLWAALAVLPPAAAPVVTDLASGSAAVATSSVFLKVASVALVSIVVGFGAGYFLGNKATNASRTVERSVTPSSIASSESATAHVSATGGTDIVGHSQSFGHRAPFAQLPGHSRQFPEAPLTTNLEMPGAFVSAERNDIENGSPSDELVPTATAFVPGSTFIRDPNVPQASRPSIGELIEGPKRGPRITDYLELSVHEGIGKQFPNSGATNVSIPIVTNTDVSVKFMVMPSFWIGAGFGLANITQKHLYEDIQTVTPFNHYVAWNLEHKNTAWFGLVAEYRQPISSRIAFAANGGVAASSLGPILSAELGLRYEVSETVGALAGIRGTRATSNVQAQHDAIAGPQANSPALIDNPGARTDPPMYNLELSTGIYFRF